MGFAPSAWGCTLATVLAVTGAVRAQSGPSLRDQLATALAKLPHASAVVGAAVIDLNSNQTIFAKNADQPLVPASTMKLFSMTVALRELGQEFAFDTLLASDGTNLYLIGDGDPGFGDEKLHAARGETITAPFERWAETLRRRGLVGLSGDVIFDESVFEDTRLHPTWERADLDNWYAAPVSGLVINDNCLDFTVSPAKGGGPAIVTTTPRTGLAKILNSCKSGGKGQPVLSHSFDSFEFKVGGRCARTTNLGSVSFPDGSLLFADAFRRTLADRGIPTHGQTRRQRVRRADGSLPQNVTILDRHQTPLGAVLARAGKDSQNLFAECLLKRAGYAWAKRHHSAEPQGSWATGASAVAELLDLARIESAGLTVADGSGLSRSNACTAAQLARLLAWAQQQPFGRSLHQSLATAGVDGSLRKRLKGSDGRIHAKTGTMKGIRALAGYVDSDAGPRFAFAVIFNGYPGAAAPYKAIQDRICETLGSAAEAQLSRR
jgi:D-alanyl-D-alanine carboxypeptidase/D-alanyl-D-alanine-endopeptidase (penicillin-binding protein 4)